MKKIFKVLNSLSKKVINQYTLAVLVICLFISLLNVSTGYREELLKQEQQMMYEKKNPIGITNYQENKEIKLSEDSAVETQISCYQTTNTEELKNTVVGEYISKLNQLFQSNNNYFSFLYQDLYSGYTVSYNEESPIFTASTIKAPAMIYLYEEASKGKINLNEKLTYTSNFYSGGSGILQTKPVGTSYTREQLIQYSIHDSDNIAYRMLMNHYGRKNIPNYWKNLETKNIYTLDTIWGVTSAKDASIYMKEMYRFSKENNTYRKRLLQYFKGAEWKLITNKDGTFNTANKGGWSGTAIHDVAIVFEKNPYLLIIMSNTGESDYQYLFQTTSKLVGQMHEEYWKYKVQKCGSINLY